MAQYYPRPARQRVNNSQDTETVITPTESRQASSRLTNFRVLVSSLVVLSVLGIGLLATFFIATPPSMDGPSSGSSGQQAPPTPGH